MRTASDFNAFAEDAIADFGVNDQLEETMFEFSR
jgi:hypothetical protein